MKISTPVGEFSGRPSDYPRFVFPKRHIPNALTISRVVLAAVFFLILALWNVNDSSPLWGRQPGSVDVLLLLAALIFIVAAATDALDGFLARKWQVVSVFGRVMDPFADKILILGAFVMLAGPAFLQLATREQTSHVLPWMAVVILARELLITSLRAAFESRGIDFSAGPSGKLKMILQSICVPIVLIAVAVRPAVSPETGDFLSTIAKWSVWLTVAVTVWSAYPYIARALAISRALPSTNTPPPTTTAPPVNVALSPFGRLLITSFGLGRCRPFPGTWGSLPPVVLAAGIAHFGISPAGGTTQCWLYHAVLLAIFIAFCLVCVVFGDYAETAFGKKDPGSVVADETAGMCIPLMLIPASALSDAPHALLTFFLAFVLFRIFDIIKPWPCYRLQTIPGGWGILIDDLFAGVYAFVGVQLITRTLMG